jgi:hypothetical protein
MNEHLRQTGRTERMIREAIRLSYMGRAVYVLVHEKSYIESLQYRIHDTVGHCNHGIKVEVLPESFDWERMRPSQSRAHPNCVWLVEHAAAEMRLEQLDMQILLLQQLQRQVYQLTL